MIRKFLLAAALAAVLALAALFLPFDFLRPEVARAMERSLGRKVDIGHVHVNLFGMPGFTLDDAVIHEDPRAGIEPFAYVPSLTAGIRVLSLFRRRLDFSSLDLSSAADTIPTVNLVKSASGMWNFQMLLEQASHNGTALPEIKIRGGRVNFKFADTKSVFFFDDADLTVSPYGRGSVELRFWGAPSRTDRPAQDFGHLFVRGNWNPSVKGAPPRLDLRVELERSGLDEVTRLIDPRGFGLDGIVSFEAQLGGPPTALQVAGALHIEDVHRWDLLPRPGRWTLPFQGALDLGSDLISQRLQLASVAESPDAPLALEFRVSNFLSAPQWDASARLNQAPLAALVEIARHMGAPISDQITAAGSVSGDVGYTENNGFEGRLELQDASLRLPEAEPLLASSADVSIGAGAAYFQSSVEIGPKQNAEIEGAYAFAAPRDFDVRISTRGMNVRDMRSFGLTGIPLLEQTPQGSWRGWARYQAGDWSGEYDLQNARIAVEGLAEPVRIQSASVRLNGKSTIVNRLSARVGRIAFTGDYQWTPDAPRPHHFHIAIAKADAAELARLLAPTLERQRGFFARTLGLSPAPLPEWLKTRRADGDISLDELSIAGAAIRLDHARLLWDGGFARLIGLDARWIADNSPGVAGGGARGVAGEGARGVAGEEERAAISGDLEIGLEDRAPHFKFDGKVGGVRYKGGQIDFEGAMEAQGVGPELLETARAQGRLHARSIALAPDAEFRSAAACFEMLGSPNGPLWKFGSVEAASGADLYTGSGASQPDGKLLLDLNRGGRPVRFVSALAEAR
jgi:hypothetical protein